MVFFRVSGGPLAKNEALFYKQALVGVLSTRWQYVGDMTIKSSDQLRSGLPYVLCSLKICSCVVLVPRATEDSPKSVVYMSRCGNVYVVNKDCDTDWAHHTTFLTPATPAISEPTCPIKQCSLLLVSVRLWSSFTRISDQ